MINSKPLKTLIAISVLAMIGHANADIAIFSDATEAQKQTTSNGYSFNQTGLSGEKANQIKGLGEDMPLGLSLQVIVPKHWNINLNAGAQDQLVSWQGSKTWPYVLEDLARRNGLNVKIDWSAKVVDVFSPKASQLKQTVDAKKAVAGLQGKMDSKNVLDKDGKITKGKNIGVEEIYANANVKPLDGRIRTFVSNVYNGGMSADDGARFILKSNLMLSDNIALWGEYTGWDIKWNASADYNITNDISLKGTLRDSIAQALKLYSKSDHPLSAVFYDGNKVVEISDFNYKDPKTVIPSGFEQ